MSEESIQERSPRAPTLSLEKCVELTTKLHAECRRSAVDAATAAKAMGYNTVHGGVLTLLGALREYGLIERPSGKVTVTALAVKIIHPISAQQKEDALRESALMPKAFTALLRDFGDCSESVLESHLVQSNFKPDRAKQVAKAFTANKAFAKLDSNSKLDVPKDEEENDPPPIDPDAPALPAVKPPPNPPIKPEGNVLATYKIPLGANEATLVFTGQQLTADDFDALSDFVDFSKKQFVRALAKKSSPEIKAEEQAP
jgi:hypothetical protein